MAVPKQNAAPSKFLRNWGPVVLYAGGIFLFSSLPGERLPALFVFQDGLFHIVEYAGFAFLVNRAVRAYTVSAVWKRNLFVFFVGLGYAISDEFHQFFVPGRSASVVDVVFDSIGILVMIIVSSWLT